MQVFKDDSFGLKSTELERICKTFSNFAEIEKAVIFGSRAKGNQKPYSDIDIALYGKSIDLTIQNKIENQLDDLLLPYKFDVCVFEKLDNQDIINHIERVGIILYLRS
jgi:type I restriction enzyme S subunit